MTVSCMTRSGIQEFFGRPPGFLGKPGMTLILCTEQRILHRYFKTVESIVFKRHGFSNKKEATHRI